MNNTETDKLIKGKVIDRIDRDQQNWNVTSETEELVERIYFTDGSYLSFQADTTGDHVYMTYTPSNE